MEGKAAAAAVHKDTSTTQLRLNDGASILQAELMAIREAIYMATRVNYMYITACIFSDSKAAIQALDSIHPHDNKQLIKNIHDAALAAKDALNRAHPDVYIATSKRQTNATPTANVAAIYKRQAETQPSASCARNISLFITHEQHKTLWKVPRHIQKDIHKLQTF